MNTNEIYREELMDMYKNPTHKGVVDQPSANAHAKNPVCGDEVTLTIKIADGLITDAKFEGSACAVSVISSEFLADYIIGKPLQEVSNLSKDELLKLTGLNLSTSRVNCATLILGALKGALEKYANDKKL